MSKPMTPKAIQQRGFSLLELLVALVVFSIGLLAVAGLQTVSKQANFEGIQRTTASQIATGLLEDMRMNDADGAGTGGLMFPTLCIDGPAVGGPGIYRVTIAWRGTASIRNSVNNGCGAATGNYGAANEFRRIIQIPTFIDPNF
jgi:prepilin-type N-terminal cleavage/methylation domain-containing protein